MLLLKFWPTMHCGRRQLHVFCFKWHHIINLSRQRDLQQRFLPLAANDRLRMMLSPLSRNWHEGTSVQIGASQLLLNLALFKNLYQKLLIQPQNSFWSCSVALSDEMLDISWQTAWSRPWLPLPWCSLDNRLTLSPNKIKSTRWS